MLKKLSYIKTLLKMTVLYLSNGYEVGTEEDTLDSIYSEQLPEE